MVQTIPKLIASQACCKYHQNSSIFSYFGFQPTEKLAPDSLQIHIRLTFVTHSVDFRYTFGFVNPHDLTFVIHSNLYSNKFHFQYIFVTHSVSGSQTPHISVDICYTFTTHSVSHSLMIIIFIQILIHSSIDTSLSSQLSVIHQISNSRA